MEKERAGIQSVEVGFSLVEALAQASGPLMLKDVAAAAGMSAAKAHRYLVSFQRIGLVTQDEGAAAARIASETSGAQQVHTFFQYIDARTNQMLPATPAAQ